MPLGLNLKAGWTAFRGTRPDKCAADDCAGDRRLAALLSAAPGIIYAADALPPFALTYISANVQEQTGHALNAFRTAPELWSELIHADDLPRRVQALSDVTAHGQASAEYRYRHADGQWRHVRDQMRCLRDEQGRIVEIVGSLTDTTDMHQLQQAQAHSERQMQNAQRQLAEALEASDDAFSVFDANDRLVVFNSRLRTFFPLIADLIQPGLPFPEMVRTAALRGQYMGVDAANVDIWVRERVARHQQAQGIFEKRLSDGRCLEVIERPTAGNGRVAIMRDVTGRKQIEEALRQELNFEQTMLDSLPFPVFFKGINGRFLGCNAKMSEFSGKPITEIVGRTLQELTPPERYEDHARLDRQILLHPGVRSHEVTLQRADGQFRRINLVTGTFNGGNDEVAGYIGSLIDITEQKRAEEQLVQAAKLATLGQIASEVAHELNQPLSIIRMSAENLLSRTSDDENGKQRLEIIVRQVCRMAEMVDHLRSFSRLEGGEKIPFSLPDVVSAAASLLVPHFQIDGIGLDIQIDQGLPAILGRPNQIEQVVLNLLTNARDAVRSHRTDGGGKVAISLSRHGEWARLIVQDDGGGIPEHVLASIFEPFFTTKGDGAGTGLGLSICSNILSGMGGKIEADNVGGGARFLVSLPLPACTGAGESPSATSETTGEEIAQPCPVLQGRVLVVDDEMLAVECIADFLEARRFKVLTATTPVQALELAAQGIDLLITDMRMPGMAGQDLIHRLRQDHPGLPAIIMTGGPLPGSASEITGIRAIRKPLALDDLLLNVNDLLTERPPACSA